jgi:hypothetical protein
MNFRTQIPIIRSNHPIDYDSKVVSLGSCFAVNMAEKFDYFKFQNSCNPFGILFHPLAIEKIVHKAMIRQEYTENDLFLHNERWYCFDVHSELSNANKDELLTDLNELLSDTYQKFTEATHVIVTYGTSWVYRNVNSGDIVANCHKVPQKQFDKEILEGDIIVRSIEKTIADIQKVNKDCHFIFTVSPVRHIKDGFVENLQSKSHLLAAIHKVLKVRKENLVYFPSYEIMMDELRDYRFYGEDMIHPSRVAIDYIWKRFAETFISIEAKHTMEDVDAVQKSLSHRPFNPDSDSHKKFLEQVYLKIKKLENDFPAIKF